MNIKKFAPHNTMNGRIWITWENQRRNRTLSGFLDARLFEFDIKLNRMLRYPLALIITMRTFIEERPSIIFVQNPSIVLAFFTVTYGKVLNIPVVVDSHNAGIYPFGGKTWWANRLATFLFKSAALTIVSNVALAEYVSQRGGKTLVLPDPLPEFETPQVTLKLKGRVNILFICTWAGDEPYSEVLKSATLLDKDVCIYITGNSRNKEKELGIDIPLNVQITGYVQEDDYVKLLYSSDIIVDLTTREDCLVCGAYEALAAEKPMILSDTKALRQYFYKGALYTDNTCQDVAAKISEAIKIIDKLKWEVKELKQEKMQYWGNMKEKTETLLRNLIRRG